jgi:hypothetical protein
MKEVERKKLDFSVPGVLGQYSKLHYDFFSICWSLMCLE